VHLPAVPDCVGVQVALVKLPLTFAEAPGASVSVPLAPEQVPLAQVTVSVVLGVSVTVIALISTQPAPPQLLVTVPVILTVTEIGFPLTTLVVQLFVKLSPAAGVGAHTPWPTVPLQSAEAVRVLPPALLVTTAMFGNVDGAMKLVEKLPLYVVSAPGPSVVNAGWLRTRLPQH
jgi:hypothetical protein